MAGAKSATWAITDLDMLPVCSSTMGSGQGAAPDLGRSSGVDTSERGMDMAKEHLPASSQGIAEPRPSKPNVSRRDALKTGMAAAVGGGASVLAGGRTQARQALTLGTSTGGQKFRAYVRFGNSASVQELRLLPISPRQVVLRSEAAQIVTRRLLTAWERPQSPTRSFQATAASALSSRLARR